MRDAKKYKRPNLCRHVCVNPSDPLNPRYDVIFYLLLRIVAFQELANAINLTRLIYRFQNFNSF